MISRLDDHTVGKWGMAQENPHRGNRRLDLLEYLSNKILVGDDHWPWQGEIGAQGYAKAYIYRDDRRVKAQAHRVVYELLVGPIPEGFVLDHVCEDTTCVRPAHMEPKTQRENLMRSTKTVNVINAAKTHCDNGHSFDEKNTYIDVWGHRACRSCKRDWWRTRAWGSTGKTHCRHGHEYTPENTYVYKGVRRCRACNIQANAEYRRRRGGGASS